LLRRQRPSFFVLDNARWRTASAHFVLSGAKLLTRERSFPLDGFAGQGLPPVNCRKKRKRPAILHERLSGPRSKDHGDHPPPLSRSL
jgi:hypothetical protein